MFKKKVYSDNPASYAYGLSIYKLMWMFVFGSFAGFLLETGWYYILRGEFVNRQGVLYGPFSPIYGLAMAMITLMLYKFRHINAFHIAVIAGLGGGFFEYILSVLQEKILGTMSWNYSHEPFNIGGRTSLKFMIMWGLLGMVYIKHAYPFVSMYIEKIPEKIGKVLSTTLCIFLVLNCILSITVSFRQKERRNGIPPSNAIERIFDRYYTDGKLESIYTEIRVLDEEGNVIYRTK